MLLQGPDGDTPETAAHLFAVEEGLLTRSVKQGGERKPDDTWYLRGEGYVSSVISRFAISPDQQAYQAEDASPVRTAGTSGAAVHSRPTDEDGHEISSVSDVRIVDGMSGRLTNRFAATAISKKCPERHMGSSDPAADATGAKNEVPTLLDGNVARTTTLVMGVSFRSQPAESSKDTIKPMPARKATSEDVFARPHPSVPGEIAWSSPDWKAKAGTGLVSDLDKNLQELQDVWTVADGEAPAEALVGLKGWTEAVPFWKRPEILRARWRRCGT